MPKEFEIDAYRHGRELLVILRGRLVLKYCQDTRTRLNSLFTPEVDQVYIYLAELSFLDSAGLGVLVGTKMNSNKHRTRLALLSPQKRVEDIFRVSKLDAIFEIRGGSEAELIRGNLQKDEYVVWRDSKEESESAYNLTQIDPQVNRDSAPLNPSPGSLGSQATEPLIGADHDPAARVKQLCGDAVEYIRQGDYDKAVISYQQALDIDPKNLSALNNLGIVYEKRPEWYTRAHEVWRMVLEVSRERSDEKHAAHAEKHLESLEKLMHLKQ